MDDIPNVESILGYLTPHPAPPGLPPLGAGTSGAGRDPIVKPEATSQDSASRFISDPGIPQGHHVVFRERRAALQVHHEQLDLQRKESAKLLLRLPPPPKPFPRTHSRRYIRLQLRPQPLRPNCSRSPPLPTQPSIPVTLRAPPLQVAPTHAYAVTSGTTTF